MGKTFARGVHWSCGVSFSFLVDTGATWLTLPPEAITRLELDVIPGQVAVITTPTDILHLPFYRASGTLEGEPLTPAQCRRTGPWSATNCCKDWGS